MPEEVEQGTHYALRFSRPLVVMKRRKKKREGKKRFWSHGQKVILKVCCLGIDHRNRKAFCMMSTCVHANSIVFGALTQAVAASGRWIQNRRAGDGSKNGKWKHVFLLNGQVLKGKQTKTQRKSSQKTKLQLFT